MTTDFSGKRIRPGPADVTHAGTRFHPSFLTSLGALRLKNQGQMGTTGPGVQRLASQAFSPPWRAAPQSPLSPLGQGRITCGVLYLRPPAPGRSQAGVMDHHLCLWRAKGLLGCGKVRSQDSCLKYCGICSFFPSSPGSWSHVSSWETWLSFKH